MEKVWIIILDRYKNGAGYFVVQSSVVISLTFFGYKRDKKVQNMAKNGKLIGRQKVKLITTQKPCCCFSHAAPKLNKHTICYFDNRLGAATGK